MIRILFITVLILLIACENSKSKEMFFLIGNDNMKISLPTATKELSLEKIKETFKYESRRPNNVFRKENDISYEFNLNYKIDRGNNTLKQFKKLYTKLFKTRKFNILTNEMRVINGKEFLYMKMLMPTQSVNTSKVDEISHFFVTFTDTKILIGNIRYPLSKDSEYATESLNCLNSIVID